MDVVENSIADNTLSIENLSKELGISKAQLYRRITVLTGFSPNNLIKEIKLRKALWVLGQKDSNVSEVAFASGFNSPSYFTKSFQKRFGTLPTQLLRE
jgi:AraC-like DNA-binding protein